MKLRSCTIAAGCLAALLFVPGLGRAQDRGYDMRDRGRDAGGQMPVGTVISVRTDQGIDVERRDTRVYYGVVDQDVRDRDGRIAVPRGSRVELMVRTARDNDLILDLDSVVVNGQRFAVKANSNRVDAQANDNTLVGSIVGAFREGVTGRAVHIPRGTVVQFRLERPLDVGVADRGVDRNGFHYHDYYDR